MNTTGNWLWNQAHKAAAEAFQLQSRDIEGENIFGTQSELCADYARHLDAEIAKGRKRGDAMKHRAPQMEMTGAESVFNLAGETVREESPRTTPAPKPDATPNFFGPCPQFRPYRRDDGSHTRRCADCGAFESEHEAKPEPPKKCGKQLFGFMPPCALDAGHADACQDGFGGSYNHQDSKPETRKEKAE